MPRASKIATSSAKKAAKKAPAKKAAKKVPAKKAAKKVPAKKAAKKVPAKKAAKKVPAKKAAKKVPAKKAAKKAAKKVSAKKVPAKKAAKKVPAKKVPAKKVPAKTVPAKKVAVTKVPVGRGPKKAATKRPALKKSPYDAKFLETQRVLLLEERDRLQHDADSLTAEANELAQLREPGDVQFDEESGEGDTLAVERERDLALSANFRGQVDEIDRALAKITSGMYGVCEVSGQSIPKERLRAIPWARERVEFKGGGFGRR